VQEKNFKLFFRGSGLSWVQVGGIDTYLSIGFKFNIEKGVLPARRQAAHKPC